MVGECVVLGTFGATLHDEGALWIGLLRLGDGLGEGGEVAHHALPRDDDVTAIVPPYEFVLVLEVVLELALQRWFHLFCHVCFRVGFRLQR